MNAYELQISVASAFSGDFFREPKLQLLKLYLIDLYCRKLFFS